MFLTAKKVDYIFEEPLNLHIIVELVRFSLFHCGFHGKIDPSWRNCLILTVDLGGERNTADTKNTLIISLQAIAAMQVIFWTKDNFWLPEFTQLPTQKAYKQENTYFL